MQALYRGGFVTLTNIKSNHKHKNSRVSPFVVKTFGVCHWGNLFYVCGQWFLFCLDWSICRWMIYSYCIFVIDPFFYYPHFTGWRPWRSHKCSENLRSQAQTPVTMTSSNTCRLPTHFCHVTEACATLSTLVGRVYWALWCDSTTSMVFIIHSMYDDKALTAMLVRCRWLY